MGYFVTLSALDANFQEYVVELKDCQQQKYYIYSALSKINCASKMGF